MVQTVSTMVALLLATGAGGVIASSLIEDWGALRRALVQGSMPMRIAPLPSRIRRLTGERGARIIRMSADQARACSVA